VADVHAAEATVSALDAFRADFERLLRIEAQYGVYVSRTCCEPGRYDAWPTPLRFRGEAIWMADIFEQPRSGLEEEDPR
jgi:hypothetical protein